MRFAVVDDILEAHVVASLLRAMVARGHQVHHTGKVWHGSLPPTEQPDLDRVEAAVQGALDFRPDAVLVMRAAALSPQQVRRFRSRGVVTSVWFSDDPVLFKVSTREAAPLYDVTLHTCGADVLGLYEPLGVHGLTFPFFTDAQAFPPIGLQPDRDTSLGAIFLGHTYTEVKRWRYDWLKGSGADVTLVGRSAPDQEGLRERLASGDDEVAGILARARYAITMSQRFRDYAGTWWDYPSLASLGVFDIPSRVIQFAASALPVIAKVDDETAPFPAVTVDDAASLGRVLARLDGDDDERVRLAHALHDWFLRRHTASRRAVFLEQVLQNPGAARAYPREARAELFADLPGERS